MIETISDHDFSAATVQAALQKPLFEKWTGCLRAFPQRYRIFLNDGYICAIEGHTPLGQILVQKGYLRERQLAVSLGQHNVLGYTLLQDGLVSETQLREALLFQAYQALEDMRQSPPTFYSFRAQAALPSPHAALTLKSLSQLSGPPKVVSTSAVLSLAPHDSDVRISRTGWELLRWFNGRRTVGRVIELSGLGAAEAQDSLQQLIEDRLLEPSAISGLPLIVARLKPATEHRQPPASIRANLFLKHLNGKSSVQEIVERLHYPVEEAALMLTGLYRDGVLDLLSGQHEMQRLLEEY